jgi:uncharacterized protein YvpB
VIGTEPRPALAIRATAARRAPVPALEPAVPAHPRWERRTAAAILIVAIVAALGGGGLVTSGAAFGLQARAAQLHERWATMREEGVPPDDLASLEQEWTVSQQTMVMGAALAFWRPGGGDAVQRWETETDAIWTRDVARFRENAAVADGALHEAKPDEPLAARKERAGDLATATTPLEYATLAQEWTLQARLVPIDAHIADLVGTIAGQSRKALSLGIKSDPADALLAEAAAYVVRPPSERMAHARFMTDDLLAATASLEARLGAAATARAAFDRAAQRLAVATLYGINLTALNGQVAAARATYASTLAVSGFAEVTASLQRVAAGADHLVAVALSQTHVIGGVPMIYQDHPLSCEEAATSMALAHQGVHLSQDQILAEIGADRRPMYVDSAGRVRWGDPYQTFVGDVNGSESNYTGYGTFYPPLVTVALRHGARVVAYGGMSAATIYARVIAGHPVVAFATWDWRWHPRRDYVAFDGRRIPWIGPVYASHVYVVVGVSSTRVLIDDPLRGQYWISKAAFEAGYSDFNEAIVFW